MARRGLKIDFMHKSIEVSHAYSLRASKFNSLEYIELGCIKLDFPDFEVYVLPKQKKKKKKKKPSVDEVIAKILAEKENTI